MEKVAWETYAEKGGEENKVLKETLLCLRMAYLRVKHIILTEAVVKNGCKMIKFYKKHYSYKPTMPIYSKFFEDMKKDMEEIYKMIK